MIGSFLAPNQFKSMLRLGILASHQGTNFQSVADACRFGELDAYLAILISNNSKAPVMKRAAELNVPAHHVSTATHKNAEDIDKAINAKLTEAKVGLVVLAGYMKKIGPLVLEEFKGRIINVHPSLLPRHGGQGFYGQRVHESVIAAGDVETGATVHHVTVNYDEGAVIRQKSIRVTENETAATLAKKVHAIERQLLLSTIKEFAEKL